MHEDKVILTCVVIAMPLLTRVPTPPAPSACTLAAELALESVMSFRMPNTRDATFNRAVKRLSSWAGEQLGGWVTVHMGI